MSQPFALCLRDRDGAVRPTVCVPAPGRRADRTAGERFSERVLIVLDETALHETYEGLLRREYAYRPYREALFGQSLTDTVMNLIDLVATDPDGDDSVDYAASPSGWWSRAKNFIDVENLETVRSKPPACCCPPHISPTTLDLLPPPGATGSRVPPVPQRIRVDADPGSASLRRRGGTSSAPRRSGYPRSPRYTR